MTRLASNLIVSGLASLTLVGCGALPNVDDVLPDRKVEYKQARELDRNLEVPPDLTRSSINDSLVIPDGGASGAATYSDFAGQQRVQRSSAGTTDVLPRIDQVEVRRDGEQSWLVVQGPVEQVWPRVIQFWQENGILLVEQDPALGIMVTDWIENRADIKSDFITNTLRKAFDAAYSAGTRDQYRVRLERTGKGGSTELFLTQRGMEEKFLEGTTGESDRSMWIPRAPDRELEVEMLRRLMVYLGMADQTARSALAQGAGQAGRAKLHQAGGSVSVTVLDELPRAWRLTGVALDRVGFAVEDRDPQKAVYYVRYNDPMAGQEEKKGWLSNLAFWKSDARLDKENRYQVKLAASAEGTEVVVLDESGVRQNSETAVRILTLLYEQLR